MNAERLLAVYEKISEAPDAIARLRNFVLDLAVRGKLVDQDVREKPASVLLAQAKAVRSKEGISHTPEAIQGEGIPFPAPHGWTWTRVGEIALQTGSGSTPRGGKSAYADTGTPFLRSQNVYDDGLRLDDVVFINDETNAKMKRTQVRAKDLLLNITGGSIGRCCRIPDEFEGANVSQHVAIIRTAAPDTEYYLHLLVRSPFFQEYVVGEQTGAGRGGLPKNRMDRIPVPLPPLAEQQRIVAKVDELMALCDRLEETRKTREETRDKLTAASLARLTAPDTTPEDFPAHAAFALAALGALTTRPDQIKTLRQTILNLAVRGKLVEQEPADEPANLLQARMQKAREILMKEKGARKKKPVAPLEDIEMLRLPTAWTADAFANLIDPKATISYGVLVPGPEVDEGVPFVRAQDLALSGHPDRPNKSIAPDIEAKYSRTRLVGGEILLCVVGSIGKLGIAPQKWAGANIARAVARIAPMPEIAREYLLLFLRSDLAQKYFEEATRTLAQPTLNVGLLERLPVPIPPRAEQHRIVAKVDALMALCDRLEAALTTTDTTRTRLLEALLHEALEPAPEALKAAE